EPVQVGVELTRNAVGHEDRLEDAVTTDETEVVDTDVGLVGVGEGAVEESEDAHGPHGTQQPGERYRPSAPAPTYDRRMTYSSPLSELPGAVAAPDDHPEAGVPWHWGDPFAEQRTATRGVAVVDRSHRHVITVGGSERLSWLHLVLSQHVSDLPADTGTEALVLDAHGHVDAHMVVAYTGDVVYLDTDPDSQATSAMPGGAKQTLLEYLQAMKFWSDVEITDATGDYAVLTLLGPDADQALGVLGTDGPLELP